MKNLITITFLQVCKITNLNHEITKFTYPKFNNNNSFDYDGTRRKILKHS